MVSLDIARQRYAVQVCEKAQVRAPAVIAALAKVPRERYLGLGPWRIFDMSTGAYQNTPDGDPRYLYQDVPVMIDPARELNSSQPSFFALLINVLELHEGEHVVHVGCATGYTTALLAEMVGTAGHVTAVEIDPELAARARRNLAELPQVTVIQADGGAHDPGPADAILIDAGATHPRRLWLDCLRQGGRLVLPLTATGWKGWLLRRVTRPLLRAGRALHWSTQTGYVLQVRHEPRGYAARFLSPVSIFSCTGARDPESDRRLGDAFVRGGWESVRSLRRDAHEQEVTCWLHGQGFCFSTLRLSDHSDEGPLQRAAGEFNA
jgi:protein-L-isoaspartate(D-aspartate) O-methyltransferase